MEKTWRTEAGGGIVSFYWTRGESTLAPLGYHRVTDENSCVIPVSKSSNTTFLWYAPLKSSSVNTTQCTFVANISWTCSDSCKHVTTCDDKSTIELFYETSSDQWRALQDIKLVDDPRKLPEGYKLVANNGPSDMHHYLCIKQLSVKPSSSVLTNESLALYSTDFIKHKSEESYWKKTLPPIITQCFARSPTQIALKFLCLVLSHSVNLSKLDTLELIFTSDSSSSCRSTMENVREEENSFAILLVKEFESLEGFTLLKQIVQDTDNIKVIESVLKIVKAVSRVLKEQQQQRFKDNIVSIIVSRNDFGSGIDRIYDLLKKLCNEKQNIIEKWFRNILMKELRNSFPWAMSCIVNIKDVEFLERVSNEIISSLEATVDAQIQFKLLPTVLGTFKVLAANNKLFLEQLHRIWNLQTMSVRQNVRALYVFMSNLVPSLTPSMLRSVGSLLEQMTFDDESLLVLQIHLLKNFATNCRERLVNDKSLNDRKIVNQSLLLSLCILYEIIFKIIEHKKLQSFALESFCKLCKGDSKKEFIERCVQRLRSNENSVSVCLSMIMTLVGNTRCSIDESLLAIVISDLEQAAEKSMEEVRISLSFVEFMILRESSLSVLQLEQLCKSTNALFSKWLIRIISKNLLSKTVAKEFLHSDLLMTCSFELIKKLFQYVNKTLCDTNISNLIEVIWKCYWEKINDSTIESKEYLLDLYSNTNEWDIVIKQCVKHLEEHSLRACGMLASAMLQQKLNENQLHSLMEQYFAVFYSMLQSEEYELQCEAWKVLRLLPPSNSNDKTPVRSFVQSAYWISKERLESDFSLEECKEALHRSELDRGCVSLVLKNLKDFSNQSGKDALEILALVSIQDETSSPLVDLFQEKDFGSLKNVMYHALSLLNNCLERISDEALERKKNCFEKCLEFIFTSHDDNYDDRDFLCILKSFCKSHVISRIILATCTRMLCTIKCHFSEFFNLYCTLLSRSTNSTDSVLPLLIKALQAYNHEYLHTEDLYLQGLLKSLAQVLKRHCELDNQESTICLVLMKKYLFGWSSSNSYTTCEKSRKFIYQILLRINDRKIVMEYLLDLLYCKRISLKIISSIPIGLENLGCTCYMNSILQVLYVIPEFRRFVLMNGSSDPMMGQLLKCFAYLAWSVKSFYNPAELIKTLPCLSADSSIDVNVQQDASEFFSHFMHRLESIFPNESTLFKFSSGMFCNKLEVPESSSNLVSEATEEFYFISLPLFKSLDKSLRRWIKPQVVQYKWEENGNGVAQDTLKSICISKLPPYLCFHLQRFEFDYELMEQKKLNSRFEFPFSIDMNPYTLNVKRSVWYDLMAIVVHLGTATSGHYYTLIKNEEGLWYEMNDEEVREVVDPSIEIPSQCFGNAKTSNAFMLFYRQRKEILTKAITKKLNFSTAAVVIVAAMRWLRLTRSARKSIRKYQNAIASSQLVPESIRSQLENENLQFYSDTFLKTKIFCEFVTNLLKSKTDDVDDTAVKLASSFLFQTRLCVTDDWKDLVTVKTTECAEWCVIRISVEMYKDFMNNIDNATVQSLFKTHLCSIITVMGGLPHEFLSGILEIQSSLPFHFEILVHVANYEQQYLIKWFLKPFLMSLVKLKSSDKILSLNAMWKLLTVLICHTKKEDNCNFDDDDILNFFINNVSSASNKRILLSCIIQHIALDSQLLEKLLQKVYDGIEKDSFLNLKKYFRLYAMLLKIPCKSVVEDGMPVIIATMASQQRYFYTITACVEMLLRICKAHPQTICYWLWSNTESWKWLITYFKCHYGPKGSLQKQKTLLVKPIDRMTETYARIFRKNVNDAKVIGEVNATINTMLPQLEALAKKQVVSGDDYTSDDEPTTLIDQRISVKWAKNKWYKGVVSDYNTDTEEHYVIYDDGDKRWYSLKQKTFKLV